MKKIALALLVLCGVIASFAGCGKSITQGIEDIFDNTEDMTFSSNYIMRDTNTGEIIEKNTNPPDTDMTSEIGEPDVNATEPTTEAEDMVESRETRLRFIAAGDNIIHSNMIDDARERSESGGYNFRDMYKYIESDIATADIAFINVETPIAGDEFEYTGYPNFNTPKENGIALVDIGFDIVNIANNHMLDKKEKGYINNIEFWERQEIFQIGGFKNADDFESVRIYNVNGISIAFLSYTYGTNGMVLPAGSEMVVPWLDAAIMERQIKAARPQADLLFVVVHWGDEDWFTPNAQQRNLTQMMIDNNVDLVLGMHPHVLQETKWVERPDGGKTLVAYSLGNFISAMLNGKNMIGAMLAFDIVKSPDESGEEKVWLENAEMIPVMTHYNKVRKGLQVYKFEDYTPELAAEHGCISEDKLFSYDYIKNLILENISQEFLSEYYRGLSGVHE